MSVADVFCDYVSTCLERFPVEAKWNLDELCFLPLAGIGRFANTHSLPSWVPNYTDKPSCLMSIKQGLADCAVFIPAVSCQKAVVVGRSLFVTGVRIAEVRNLSEAFSTGVSMMFCCDFIARYKTYRNGIPSLQALFRVMKMNTTASNDYTTFKEVMGFLLYIFLALKDLGLSPSAASAALGQAPDCTFKEWILRTFFPSTDRLDEISEASPLYELRTFRDPEDVPSFRTSCEKLIADIVRMPSWGFFDTNDGHLGLAPKGTLPGDSVCVLKGCGVPVVLRKSGNQYLHVGTCFVLGFMEGETRPLLMQGILETDVFELV